MHLKSAALLSAVAVMADAIPHQGHGHAHLHAHQSPVEKRQDDNFKIHVHNNCASDLSFGVFQITSDFQMIQITDPVSVATGSKHVIHAPFTGTGMRLSGTADQGCAAQWNPQALFEFGYSEYAGQSGTAYDLSLMTGSDPSIGVSVEPLGGGPSCPSKTCFPTNCPPGQGWTNPDQVDAGSPGDTVCYQGKQNFKVTWCP